MPFLRRNKKPQPGRPPVDLTWRRPRSQSLNTAPALDEFNQPDCLFAEDALSLEDALMARVRDYGQDMDHV
jgi:hypothetical protein